MAASGTLKDLLAADPVSLDSVLSCEQLRMAFKSQSQPLLAFLGQNVITVTRIALGRVSTAGPA
jgi:hypothetical protein